MAVETKVVCQDERKRKKVTARPRRVYLVDMLRVLVCDIVLVLSFSTDNHDPISGKNGDTLLKKSKTCRISG